MAKIEIKKVETKKDLTRFIDFHYDLYKGNKYDAPNLFSDDFNTLSKDRNAAFDFCEAEYYMAFDENGKMVGRVAAIINHKANEKWGRKVVRFGWIDFVDDIEVSEALFKAVEEFGHEKGMTEIVGPLGFTDLDPEGMLTDGFDQLGTMPTIYNYPYYPKHMEQMGNWEKDNDYIENKMFVPEQIPEKYVKVAEMIQKRYNLKVKKPTKKELLKEGLGYELFDIINEAYKDLYEYSPLTERQINQYIDMYFPLADLSLITLVVDGNLNDKVVGVGISIPSLTVALQKCRKGRLLPFGWWHLLKALKFHKTKVVDLLLVGVLPEYRSKGANSLLFTDLIPRYQAYGFEWAESQVEMETNQNIQNQFSYLSPIVHKRRRCYKRKVML